MPIAFLLINVDKGSESEVLGALKKIDAVEEAYIVYGVHDVVAKVKVNTVGKLKEIGASLRRLERVGSTITMMAIEETK